MDGIDVVEGDLGDLVVVASSGSNGISPAETTLEGLLGSKDSILLDPLGKKVYVNHDGELRTVDLTTIIYKIMECLLKRNGKAVSHDDIANEVYATPDGVSDEAIRSQICITRKKLGERGMHIETIYGWGYRAAIPGSNTTTPNMQYHFGEFVLDVDAHYLYHGDGRIRIKLQHYLILKSLIEKEGKPARFTELRAVCSRFPLDDSPKEVRTLIKQLRKLLGDDPENPNYIKSAYGVGFQFVAAVRKVYEMPRI